MANQELISYIKAQTELGIDKETIRNSLIAAGWQPQDVEEGFLGLEDANPISQPKLESAPIVDSQDEIAPLKRKKHTVLKVFVVIFALIVLGIAVGGYFFFNTNSSNLALETAPQKTVSETIDWETYRSGEYGFEIEYPKDWKVNQGGFSITEEGETVNVSGIVYLGNGDENTKTQQGILIAKPVVIGKLSLDNIVNQIVNNVSPTHKILYTKTVNFNGLEGRIIYTAYTSEGFDYTSSQLIVLRNDKVYSIDGILYDSDLAEYKDVIEKSLLSFKFIDQANTVTDWKLYENDQYGFTINYPKEWQVKEGSWEIRGVKFQGIVAFLNENKINKTSQMIQFEAPIPAKGRDVDSSRDLLVKALKNALPDYRETFREKKSINGEPAIISHSIDDTGFRQIELMIVRNNTIYSIHGDLHDSDWNEYKNLIEQSLLSFKFTK